MIFFQVIGIKAHATHSAGADISYRCLGGLQYELTVTFYRDCGGVAEPASIQISCKSVSGSYNFYATANKIALTGEEISLPCSTAVTSCNGGSTTGLRKFIYKAVVTLPSAEPDWVFSYSLCCRNCSITTITNPCANISTLYIEATLNNTIILCNNSPSFSNIPITFVSIGQNFNFNHGAIDTDGDSLSYSLITPRTSASSYVNYIAPHNTFNPIISSTPFILNSLTGDINFTPVQTEIGILTLLVKEYRNGQLIGSVIRDMQIYTHPSQNNLPIASGINGTNNHNVTLCPGQQICFTVSTMDLDSSQMVSLTTNYGISNATYNIINSPHPTLEFCWTPSINDVSSSPKTFTVTVTDDACPTK